MTAIDIRLANWDEIRFFKKAEFLDPEYGVANMSADFMSAMDGLRLRMDGPLIVNSGYRTEAHNAAIGGSEHSAHCLGLAADVRVHGEQAYRLIRHAMKIGFTGIGIAQRGPVAGRFIHLDMAPAAKYRPRPWCWSY